MKREPKPGEMAIEHKTVNTGHTLTVAVCPENFRPEAVKKTGEMLDGEIVGFRIVNLMMGDIGCRFTVNYRGLPLSLNTVTGEKDKIVLETEILAAAARRPDEVLRMLADLEQCAAIAFMNVEGYR